MINKKLLQEELQRFNEILNYGSIINEGIGGFTDNVLRDIIKKTILNAVRTSTDDAIKKALNNIKNITVLPIKNTEFIKNIQKEVTDQLKKSSQARTVNFDSDYYKMAIKNQVETTINSENENITKTLKDAAEKSSNNVEVKAKKEKSPTQGTSTSTSAGTKKPNDTDDFARIIPREKNSFAAKPELKKLIEPGNSISNETFKDALINWDLVKYAKNMDDYNKLIKQTLTDGNFERISRRGFEQYGIPDFRQFLKDNLFNPSQTRGLLPGDKNWRMMIFKSTDIPVKTPIEVVQNNLRNIDKVPDILKKSDWTPLAKRTTFDAANELVRNNRRLVDDIIGLGRNIKDPVTKKKWIDRLTDLGIFTIKDGKRKLTRKGWLTGAAIFGVGSVLVAYVLGGDAEEDKIDTNEVTLDLEKTGEEIADSVEKKWRLLDNKYGQQLKTALGKDPSEAFTDQDIDDIYKRLTDLNIIQ